MKRFFALIICILMLTLAACGEIEYWTDNNGCYTVAGIGTCTDAQVVIPQTYKGVEVTSINYLAFRYCTRLTTITIPDSVTSIRHGAFTGCSSLTSINIPSSVTSIDSAVFHSCSSLTSITIPDSITSIGEYAFAYCTSLTSITIPDSVTSIDSFAFESCTSLTSITYTGTMEQWKAIALGNSWKSKVPATEVICSDGAVSI